MLLCRMPHDHDENRMRHHGEFEGLGAHGGAEDLMTQADAEDGDASADQFFGAGDGAGHRSRVTGAIGEKDAVGLQGQDVGGAGAGGYHGQLDAAAFEEA